MRKQFNPHGLRSNENEMIEIVDFGEQSAILIPKDWADKIDPYSTGRVPSRRVMSSEFLSRQKDAVKKG